MALTDVAIRKAKPGQPPTDSKTKPGAPYKLFDERGLFLLVTPNGGKLWRLKYRMGGKDKTLALGAYPDVSLSQARDRRDEARKRVAEGGDPSVDRKIAKAAKDNTFATIAAAWHAKKKAGDGKREAKWSESHAEEVWSRIEQNLVRPLGSRPIGEIKRTEIIAALEKMEARGSFEAAHRVAQFANKIFAFARDKGLIESNPADALHSVLKDKAKVQHRAAIVEPKKAAGLLRVLDEYEGTFVVQCALRLAPLVFVRPGELRRAEWSEIDLEAAEWSIPPERMKMREPHLVPLSRQAVEILTELRRVTGEGRYLFPSGRGDDRPMSDNAVLAALRRCGIPKDEMTGHGFRAMARTILDEVLGFRVDVIEHQLAHKVKDPNGRAYNRTSFLPERIAMMQRWADYLDGIKKADPSEQGGAHAIRA